MQADTQFLPGRRALAFTTSRDDLYLPQLPRLRTGVRVTILADGVQFDGMPDRQLLRGPGALKVLPRLLPLLDGTRTVAELAAAVDCPLTQLEQVRAVMNVRGLLENGPVQPGPRHPAELALGRLGATTWVDTHAGDAMARLDGARVALIADDGSYSSLRESLTTLGVHVGGPVAEADLVVCPIRADLPIEAFADTRPPHLPAQLVGGIALIGPLLIPETPLCLPCLRAETDRYETEAADQPSDPTDHALFEALLCRQIIAVLARTPPITVARPMLRYDLRRWTTDHCAPAPSPGCRTCSPHPVAPIPTTVPTALRFEAAVARIPGRFASGTGPLASIDPRHLSATAGGKTWPSARRVALPPANEVGIEQLVGRQFDLDVLALLLSRTVGLRDPQRSPTDRWAPAGGNIGSVHLHLRAEGIAGLADGWYGYHIAQHTLALLTAGRTAVDGLPAGVLLVLTGGYRRLVGKYGSSGIRLMAFDAGVAFAQLDVVARGVGRQADVLDDYPVDGVVDRLLLEPDIEPVTTMVRVT